MGKYVHVAAVACSVIACILFIVAATSSSWLTGCLLNDSIFKAMKNLSQTREIVKANEEAMKMQSGTKLCIDLGLFKVNVKSENLPGVSSGVDINKMQKGILFGIAAAILAITLSVIGAILLLVAAFGDTESHEGKEAAAKHTRVAMILIVLAACASLIGMAAYTGATMQASKDPLMFLAQVGLVAGSAITNMVAEPSSYARGKRDLSSGLSPTMRQYVHTMTEGMEQSYGHAFALGWVAVLLMICSAVLSAVPKKRLQPELSYHRM